MNSFTFYRKIATRKLINNESLSISELNEAQWEELYVVAQDVRKITEISFHFQQIKIKLLPFRS
jgi:hypothetical protein